MCHCWRLSSQVSLSHRCKTWDKAHFRETFISLLHASTGRNRPCAYLCRLSRHFAQSSSQQSLLGRRTASSPGMHQACRICSRSLLPRTGAQRAPASGTGRCRTTATALQALLLSLAGADSKHAGPLGVLLGWMSRGWDPVPSYPTLRCNHSSEGGEELSALPSRAGEKNFLGCLLLGGWKRYLSRSEWLGLWRSSLSPGSPSSQGVSPFSASRDASVRSPAAPARPACSSPWASISPAARLRARTPSGPAACPGRCRRGFPGWGWEEKGTAAPGTETARRLPEPADTRRRGARKAGGGGTRRVSLAPEGHQPHSSPHPGLHL